MIEWLIIYNNGSKEIVKAEDLGEIHRLVDSLYVEAVINLHNISNGYVKMDE